MASTPGKIYTRRGDQGQTRLLSGERVSKDNDRVQTYGALDELQAQLGMALSLIRHESFRSIICAIQEDIILAAAELASSPEAALQSARRIDQGDVVRLEDWIDECTELYSLPRRFVRPGRSADSAAVHVARAVCRRCERFIVMLNRHAGGYDDLLVYFNRLSDLLFVVAWCLEVNAVVEKVVCELAACVCTEGSGR
jgi:ATP:cob(I)alamin adenosyltransferase